MCGPHARESCANDDMPSSPIVTASPTHGENVDPCCNVAAPACNRSHPSPHRQPARLRSIMHPAQRLTVAVRLCALVHEGIAVLQELHRRLLDVLDSLAGRHGCRGTELRGNLPRKERHGRSYARCLVSAGPIGAEAVVEGGVAHVEVLETRVFRSEVTVFLTKGVKKRTRSEAASSRRWQAFQTRRHYWACGSETRTSRRSLWPRHTYVN